MYEFTPPQRNLLILLMVLLTGGIGWGLRMNAQAPPVQFIAGAQASENPVSPSGARSRLGGASLKPAPRPANLVVHVAGAVKHPGVYALAPGKRVNDAVKAAGGPTRGADLDAVNLAAMIGDGQQILIPKKGADGAGTTGGGGSRGRGRRASVKSAPSMVNVNTASAEELDALPGVGPSTAQKILDYRNSHGPFTSPEGLMEVKGIGPKKLEKMRPYLLIQ